MPIFSLTGGICCSTIGWIIPYILRLSMLKEKSIVSRPKIYYIIGLISMIIISISSTYQTLSEL